MKKIIQLGLVGLIMIAMQSNLIAQVSDSITMGDSYANDVFYSFYYGEVKSEPRTNWDIAFYTTQFSAGIITNDGSGVMLYTYPKGDTADWNNVDTAGLSNWPVLYNSIEDWENGAFNRNAMGHPDYGWGVYNMINHNVVGDSIFIIRTVAGDYKKVWIEQKNSVQNRYVFRYADLDNANEMQKDYVLNDYLGKNFAYYSFETDQLIDREPPRDEWDVVWTKYVDPFLAGFSIPTGILNNVRVANNRFAEVPLTYSDYGAKPMDTVRAGIGYDWKEFDFGSFSYEIVDSLVFFVQDYYGDIYKLYFESFEISTGKTVFVKENLYSTSISDAEFEEQVVSIAPNPVREQLRFTLNNKAENLEVLIYDLAGKVVKNKVFTATLNGEYTIDAADLKQGFYLLNIRTGKENYTQKFIVE